MDDDFPELAEKIKTAESLVIGGYMPYSQIDEFTKALFERFWSFKDQEDAWKEALRIGRLIGERLQ